MSKKKEKSEIKRKNKNCSRKKMKKGRITSQEKKGKGKTLENGRKVKEN